MTTRVLYNSDKCMARDIGKGNKIMLLSVFNKDTRNNHVQILGVQIYEESLAMVKPYPPNTHTSN